MLYNIQINSKTCCITYFFIWNKYEGGVSLTYQNRETKPTPLMVGCNVRLRSLLTLQPFRITVNRQTMTVFEFVHKQSPMSVNEWINLIKESGYKKHESIMLSVAADLDLITFNTNTTFIQDFKKSINL